MSFEDLSSEDKQEVWGAIGATLGQYWSKVDVILDDAIKVSVDPRIVNELTALKGLTAGAGLALGAVFTATDEFVLNETDRSTEWMAARTAVRTLVSFGSAFAVGTAAGMVVAGPLGPVVGLFAGGFAAYFGDEYAEYLLDQFEQGLSLNFSGLEIPPEYEISAGYGFIVDAREANNIQVGPGRGGRVAAGDGDDTITGSDMNSPELGSDILEGQGGNDEIFGLRGNDVIWGDAGDDHLEGGDHDDEIHGGADNDTILGGAGSDTIFGDGGDDIIFGEGGTGYDEASPEDSDTISGGLGNDKITVGVGEHDVHGDAGNDEIKAVNAGGTYDGGDGDDIRLCRKLLVGAESCLPLDAVIQRAP